MTASSAPAHVRAGPPRRRPRPGRDRHARTQASMIGALLLGNNAGQYLRLGAGDQPADEHFRRRRRLLRDRGDDGARPDLRRSAAEDLCPRPCRPHGASCSRPSSGRPSRCSPRSRHGRQDRGVDAPRLRRQREPRQLHSQREEELRGVIALHEGTRRRSARSGRCSAASSTSTMSRSYEVMTHRTQRRDARCPGQLAAIWSTRC